MVRQLMDSSLFREEIGRIVENRATVKDILASVEYSEATPEYPELGARGGRSARENGNPIFITARFRSGSTFLWNIFRNLPGFTAYYEPLLHEAPAERGKAKKGGVDSTHAGVTDYHSEYRAVPGLDRFHDPGWAFKKIYMNECDFDINLERFIDLLIDSADGRPVLQFNRVDFRLQWLRSRYPSASILHLYRNPRDQWMSMIRNDQYIPIDYVWDKNDRYPPINAFYMLDWWRDLHFSVPALRFEYLDHPYQIHYILWRMSYMFGKQHSDFSIRYESLVNSFHDVMAECFKVLHVEEVDLDRLMKTVKPREKGGAWHSYADDKWFKRMEQNAEELLGAFLAPPEPAGAKADHLRWAQQ